MDHLALFGLIRSRGSARIGAECEHPFADDDDDRIPAIDTSSGMLYLGKQKRGLVNIYLVDIRYE